MGASWQPKWWTDDKHGSGWEHVKDALKRDWEQTKADLHVGGRDLHQDVGDTVKQAVGKEPIPASTEPTTERTRAGLDLSWDDAEEPLMYGYGARKEFGADHEQWNDNLETTLKNDWETRGAATRKWEDVKSVVRHGYDRGRR